MRILLGVNTSKFAEDEAQAIVRQFRPQDTEVQVLHVLQPVAVSSPPQMAASYAPELSDQVQDAREWVERTAQVLRTAGFQVETTVKTGDVQSTIIDSAADSNADLIVIGCHERGDIQRLFLGNTADFVARHAPCSVEIVRTRVRSNVDTRSDSIPE
jgi:nucleotide-binding universal stress UspA family protein